MFYDFPRIVHINQALEAIKGDEDLFYVVEKDGYTVINYKLPCNKTFPAVTDRNTAIRRELRGIKFDSVTGEIIARPFHKFFNLGEREETLLPNVDTTKPFLNYEKADGSMVHPIFLADGVVRWCTKMGVTEIAMQAETFIAAAGNVGLRNFLIECQWNNLTPIFEWCTRKNKIILDYPQDRLILTAVRHNYSGLYDTHEELLHYSLLFDLDLIDAETPSTPDLKSFSDEIYAYDEELKEGVVLRFDNGHMVKIKTQKYVDLHRTKDKIQRERNLVAVILGGSMDDLKPFMLDEDKAKAERYEAQLNRNVIEIINGVSAEVKVIETHEMTRKEYALNVKSDPFVRSIVFNFWDKGFPLDEIGDEVMKRLRDACDFEQKFERLKPILLKGCEW